MGALDPQAFALLASSEEQAAGIMRAWRAGLSPLKKPPPIRLNEWMHRHFVFSAESSHGQARWLAFPYQPAIADWMDDDRIEELDVQKSARVGYTKLLVGYMLFSIEHRRRNFAIWQPTDSDRNGFVKTEIEPALRDVAVMQHVLLGGSTKSKHNTLEMKIFIGCVLHTLGAKASGNFRRITVPIAALDEADGMDGQVEGSGSPDSLAKKRTEGALHPKLVVGSSPLNKDTSIIGRRIRNADAVMRFHIECRHCGADHPLIFGGKESKHGFKWEKDQPETVVHVCPHCEGRITQADYLKAWHAGIWRSRCGTYLYGQDRQWRLHTGELTQPPRHVGVLIWTAYSPQTTWEAIAREKLEAVRALRAGNKGPSVSFINETLGEEYEDEDADKMEGADLAQRAAQEPQPYKEFTAPQRCLVPVAAIDTQDNRWEVQYIGRGRDEETWVIGYDVIYGNPALEDEWERLYKEVRARIITHESGNAMSLRAIGIDVMGHFTQQAYAFIRKHEHERVFALRGAAKEGKPIKGKPSAQDVNYRGKIIKNGVRLWEVGTDTAKDLIFGRLTKVNESGPGYIHFPLGLSDEYYKGLTIERRTLVRTARGVVSRWVNPSGGRNEPWDTMVYAEFLFQALDLHRYSSKMWAQLEAMYAVDLLSMADAVPKVVAVDEPPPPVTDNTPAPRARVRASPFAKEDWNSRL